MARRYTTLGDVVDQLKNDNATRETISDNTESAASSLMNLTNEFSKSLDEQRLAKLQDLERLRELKDKKDVVEKEDKSDNKEEGFDFWKLFSLAGVKTLLGGFIGTLFGTLSAITLGILGATGFENKILVPIKWMFNKIKDFFVMIKNYGLKILGYSDDVINDIKLASEEFKSSKVLTGFKEKFGYAILKIKDFFKSLMIPFTWLSEKLNIPENLSKLFTKIGELRIVQWLKGVGKLLRPIAVVFSIFDGLTNAEKEMKDRTGFLDKYVSGGLGGFLAGFGGSFIGEMFDFLKDIGMSIVKWVMKKLFPSFLDEKGEFKEGSILKEIEEFDISENLKKLIQGIFDALIHPLDSIKTYINYLAEKMGFDTPFPEMKVKNLPPEKQKEVKKMNEEIEQKKDELETSKQSNNYWENEKKVNEIKQLEKDKDEYIRENDPMYAAEKRGKLTQEKLESERRIGILDANFQKMTNYYNQNKVNKSNIGLINKKISDAYNELQEEIQKKKNIEANLERLNWSPTQYVDATSNKNVTFNTKNVNQMAPTADFKSLERSMNLGGY